MFRLVASRSRECTPFLKRWCRETGGEVNAGGTIRASPRAFSLRNVCGGLCAGAFFFFLQRHCVRGQAEWLSRLYGSLHRREPTLNPASSRASRPGKQGDSRHPRWQPRSSARINYAASSAGLSAAKLVTFGGACQSKARALSPPPSVSLTRGCSLPNVNSSGFSVDKHRLLP